MLCNHHLQTRTFGLTRLFWWIHHQDALAVGTDTTVLTSEWAMVEVLRDPTIMKKVRLELHCDGLNRVVQESDIPELKYMQAIVKEVLHLHLIAPLLVPHQNTNSTKAFG